MEIWVPKCNSIWQALQCRVSFKLSGLKNTTTRKKMTNIAWKLSKHLSDLFVTPYYPCHAWSKLKVFYFSVCDKFFSPTKKQTDSASETEGQLYWLNVVTVLWTVKCWYEEQFQVVMNACKMSARDYSLNFFQPACFSVYGTTILKIRWFGSLSNFGHKGPNNLMKFLALTRSSRSGSVRAFVCFYPTFLNGMLFAMLLAMLLAIIFAILLPMLLAMLSYSVSYT